MYYFIGLILGFVMVGLPFSYSMYHYGKMKAYKETVIILLSIPTYKPYREKYKQCRAYSHTSIYGYEGDVLTGEEIRNRWRDTGVDCNFVDEEDKDKGHGGCPMFGAQYIADDYPHNKTRKYVRK